MMSLPSGTRRIYRSSIDSAQIWGVSAFKRSARISSRQTYSQKPSEHSRSASPGAVSAWSGGRLSFAVASLVRIAVS